ncbi:MAG: RHS domain-containing protein [Proteobacteria bacterium]|nr:RHS domain-containing protein [Pseudomonadota bacterium]
MVSVELPDGRTVTYAYDPFGRRIKKDVNGDITYYIYSNEGLIGEYDASGTLKKAYGWLPDMVWGTAPVFMEENGQYYYYHNDHLGTPRKMTDSAGAVVWSANYTAFGKATVDVSSTVTNNLRFPGQYFDEETGLCYNLNRYYDPGTGRYTQADPIGFGGEDSNLYRYVLNNPVNLVDPDGLVGLKIGKVVGDWVYKKAKQWFINKILKLPAKQTGKQIAKDILDRYEGDGTTNNSPVQMQMDMDTDKDGQDDFFDPDDDNDGIPDDLDDTPKAPENSSQCK